MLLHYFSICFAQEEGEHKVRKMETEQTKNQKQKQNKNTNKETAPGGCLVYVISQASRSLPKILVPWVQREASVGHVRVSVLCLNEVHKLANVPVPLR